MSIIKLSVIIPCLNAADTITDQLEALANQYLVRELGYASYIFG